MKIINFFSKNKLLTLIIIASIFIFGVGIIGKILIESKISNWQETTEQQVDFIEHTSQQIINNCQTDLTHKKDQILTELKKSNEPTFANYESVLTKFNGDNYKNAILKNNELFVWDEHFLENLIPSDTNKIFNETLFYDSGINSYLVVRDTFKINQDIYELLISQIIEKQYQLNEDYFNERSLSKNIIKVIGTDFSIDFSSKAEKTKDGRKHSFELKNNKNNIIAIATFLKPSRENAINELENTITTLQSLIILISYLLFGYFLWKESFRFSNQLVKVILSVIYLIALRYVFIFINFPRIIFSSALLDEKYFYSKFGFGLTNSPLELFITLSLLFLVFLIIYRNSLDYFRKPKISHSNYFAIAIIFFSGLILYLLALRGFGATIRSFVFDTSIRYFQSTSLEVPLPHFLMHVNSLLIAIISILGSASILVIIFRFLKNQNSLPSLKIISLAIIIFFLGEIIFSLIQKNPQLTLTLKFFHILIVFILFYVTTNVELKRITRVIFYFLAASIFSISSLLFYNSALEKASLKTTAVIISRVDDDWYKNLIYETLLSDFSRNEALKAFENGNTNFNSSAFKIWSKSDLQKESINSSVNFIDLSGKLLGGFGSVYPKITLDKFIDTNVVIEEIQIFEEPIESESQKLIRGIFPVKDEYAFLGYLDISILSDQNDFGFSTHPEFISTGKLNDKAILKLDKLNILDYRNNELKMVYGNINPTQKLNEIILNYELTNQNDAWIDSQFGDAEYIIYIKKVIIGKVERKIAVALRGKELSIGLFDFFKVFFSHSLILLFIIIAYFIYYLAQRQNYQLDLRSRLLVAFLVISLIPLILTAYYFRNFTEEKNQESIYYKLGKRAFNIETYLNDNRNGIYKTDLYDKATRDLNINFSIYRQNILEYSSQDLLYDIGLMPKVINPNAFAELLLNGSQEILVQENIEKYKINAFYYKADLLGEDVIVKVTDGFNKIELPLSGSEVDVLLFGFYALAVVLIIIFSAIFANQISLPIRKITSATKSIAAGDLNLELKSNAKGELGELVSGFQYMIRELKRNQTILAEIEREEAWKEMAKQVAHEIKNPLTPMKLSVQQLITAYNDNSDKFDSFFKKVTATILNQIETLKNIATEFSNFARMPKLKVEKINCVEVVNQAINLFTDENIDLNFIAENENIIINGDSEQLKRAIINLIRNSIQANATEINLNIKDTNESVMLKVNDNGDGISEENIVRIFEPNFSTKKEGMGLGLSMAKRYLKSTGADIFVESTSEKGTTIILTFPKI